MSKAGRDVTAGESTTRREFLRRSAAGVAGMAALPGVARGGAKAEDPPPAAGPLKVHPTNPRLFADPTGRAVYLTGSHTWADLHERAYDETPAFEYGAWLEFLAAHHHNFMRLWAWEHAAWMQFTDRMIRYAPNRYVRTGSGKALDGGAKFDVAKLNGAFFERLRKRIVEAGRRGIYVAVMLFQGFSIEQKGTKGVDRRKGNPWDGHPFHRDNNVNGIDGDPGRSGEGRDVHTLKLPAVTRLQEAFVRKVIETVNDLDNVLFEVSNESHSDSTKWQYHVIDLIHAAEAKLPKQHPVGMTFQWDHLRNGRNADLFAGPAEWISPNAEGGYRDDPPAADGRKVIVTDTDHLWGIGGNAGWVWKSFCRGLHPIFMDPYLDARTGGTLDRKYDPIRRAMGQTLRLAERMDLAAMTPRGELASSGYCLAKAAKAAARYVAYLPKGGRCTMDLSATPGELAAEWIEPVGGKVHRAATVRGGARRALTAPFDGDAVLHLTSAANEP
ncbi:MAG TPA: hypothetical protein VM695_11475 [Phycisphaerae bacterium]|nr:hypothetical protein [Phycisphaerae bacterium]